MEAGTPQNPPHVGTPLNAPEVGTPRGGTIPPALKPLETPAMVTLSMLVKLATIAERTRTLLDNVTDVGDEGLGELVNDDKVRALIADMRRVGLLK